jgi:hypothetical protein
MERDAYSNFSPARVSTLDIEGQPVRCIEEPSGKRLWLCDCPKFTARAAGHPEASMPRIIPSRPHRAFGYGLAGGSRLAASTYLACASKHLRRSFGPTSSPKRFR